MRQRLFIFFGLFILIALLVGLNAASYTQTERVRDSEMLPNRSTFNGGATGSRAYFDLLNETGHKVVRWLEPPTQLDGPDAPSTLVIIGELREDYSDQEIEQLLGWVSRGKRLVLIDRTPAEAMVKSTGNYGIVHVESEQPFFDTDAYDQTQMTFRTNAAKPLIPTLLTAGVNAIQPSRFASSITINRVVRSSEPVDGCANCGNNTRNDGDDDFTAETTPKIRGNGEDHIGGPSKRLPNDAPPIAYDEKQSIQETSAPVVHFANDRKTIVVDAPYGAGRITFVSDPYIVSNTGIGIADNVAFAVNLVKGGGTVAFDEYHNGYGSNRNRFFEFFAGTPVIAMFLQIALVVGLVFFSKSRRFARPVPEPEPDRLSKLEYVSAMAELQQRTKGYDIAIENIYTDFRRRVARLVGVDNFSTHRHVIAAMIVERLPDENPDEIESVMQRCEDVMHGDRTGKKEVVRLTTRLREIEGKLGLQRRKKKAKQ